MHEYEKITRRVSLFVAVTALVVQVIANEIPSVGKIGLFTKMLFAISIGVISFLIMEWLPKLLLKEKSLCGLYMITYEDDRNNLCSIVNIEHNNQRGKYSIDVYDCYLQGSCWGTVENQYPINLDNIFYDLSPRGLHLVSNNDNYKTCIFIRFTYKINSGSVIRYGSQEPFNKPYFGKFKKLSPGQLCEVFNSGYQDYQFCNLRLSKYKKCEYEKRENCQQKERVILDKVREKGNYTKIAKVLYHRIATMTEPSGIPKSKKVKKKNKPESKVGVNERDKETKVDTGMLAAADAKEESVEK